MSRTVSPSPEKSSGVGSGVLVAVITGVAVGVGGKAFVEMIIGVSAGSIMLAKQWIDWPDENNEASAELFPCMNIAPVICDTHGEEDEWNELHSLVHLTEGDQIGYGIPSGGAMRISPDGVVEAISMPLFRIEQRGGKIARINDLAATN